MFDIPQSFLFNLAITIIVGAMMFIYVGGIKRHVETKLEAMFQLVQAITSEITILKSLNQQLKSNIKSSDNLSVNQIANSTSAVSDINNERAIVSNIELQEGPTQNIELTTSAIDEKQDTNGDANGDSDSDDSDDSEDSDSEDDSDDSDDSESEDDNEKETQNIKDIKKINVELVDNKGDLVEDSNIEDLTNKKKKHTFEQLHKMQVKDLKEILESKGTVKGFKTLKKNALIDLVLETEKTEGDENNKDNEEIKHTTDSLENLENLENLEKLETVGGTLNIKEDELSSINIPKGENLVGDDIKVDLDDLANLEV